MRWPWQVTADAVAGAVTVPGTSNGSKEEKPQGWQATAWRLWGQLGELYFPTTYIARQVSRVDWDFMVNGEPIDRTQSEQRIALVTAGLGGEEASRLIALNLLVAGDGNYIQTDDLFEVVSVVAEKRKDKLDAADINKRFYNPDPRDTRRSTSSVQTAVGPGEELVTLTNLSKVQALSRLNAGILYTPTQAKFGDADPFGYDLETAMSLAIADPNHPTAFVPIHVEMDKALIPEANGGPRHQLFERPYDDRIDGKIELATRRIALALDMPAELLLGLGDVNHWGAWLISEETYTAHVGPLAQQVGEVYAAVWEDLTGEIVEVQPDPTALLAHRSSVRDAFDALDRLVVGYDYVREVMGADEDDAPTLEDIELLLAVRQRTRDGTVAENPGVPTTGEAVGAAQGRIDLDVLAGDLAQIDVGLRGELIGAVAQAGATAREKIGSRARSLARSDPVLREKLADLTLDEIGSTLGLQSLLLLGVEVDKITDESTTRLERWWTARVPQAYAQVQKLGVPVKGDFAALAEASAELLRDGVSKWIVTNLDRDEPLAIPTDVIRLTVARAGGQ